MCSSNVLAGSAGSSTGAEETTQAGTPVVFVCKLPPSQAVESAMLTLESSNAVEKTKMLTSALLAAIDPLPVSFVDA